MRWLVLFALAGCGEDVGDFQPHFDLGTCGVVDIYPQGSRKHVAQGSVIEYETNPPTSGDHFAIWAAYDKEYPSLDRGFWMHDAEHGAIVVLHRCDATSDVACQDTVAQLVAAVAEFPVDETCEAPVRNRALVVFDPLLPEGADIAAVAWGKAYTATCVDPVAIADFRTMFYGRAPENTCAQGVSLGGTVIE